MTDEVAPLFCCFDIAQQENILTKIVLLDSGNNVKNLERAAIRICCERRLKPDNGQIQISENDFR
jgi:hypothetical protein